MASSSSAHWKKRGRLATTADSTAGDSFSSNGGGRTKPAPATPAPLGRRSRRPPTPVRPGSPRAFPHRPQTGRSESPIHRTLFLAPQFRQRVNSGSAGAPPFPRAESQASGGRLRGHGTIHGRGVTGASTGRRQGSKREGCREAAGSPGGPATSALSGADDPDRPEKPLSASASERHGKLSPKAP